MHRSVVNGGCSIDRIISSPSTEFDSLDSAGLAGLADFREDSLYPDELADDYVRLDSASCTPRPERKIQGVDLVEEAGEDEVRDRVTALPPPSLGLPQPKVVGRTSSAGASRQPVGTLIARGSYVGTSGSAGNSVSSAGMKSKMMSQLTEEDAAQFAVEHASGRFDSLPPQSFDVDARAAFDSQIFDASSLEVHSVTVYLDRAEVCRRIRLRVPAGESELLIKSLTSAIDKDSIRVEVKGSATIADVSYTARRNKADAATKTARRTAAKEALCREQLSLDALCSRQTRLCKQRDVLNSFADMLIRKPLVASNSSTRNSKDSLAGAFDPKYVNSLNSFFDLYGRQAARLDEELAETRLQTQLKEESIKTMETQLKMIETNYAELLSREVSIVIESQESEEIELRFSYVVTRAKWNPKYDIRVFSNESALKIIYYGLVQQTTGEDWNNCQLSLSTCRPGIGGSAPVLGIQKAHFKLGVVSCGVDSTVSNVALRKSASKLRKSRKVGKTRSLHAPNEKSLTRADTLEEPVSADEGTGRAENGLNDLHASVNGFGEGGESRSGCATLTRQSPRPSAASAAASSHIQRTQFSVPRLFSIPADGADHKVTIGIIDLSPTFEYECVPQKAPYAFLKANVTNTSGYPLLAGKASIYVDNKFVADSELRSAAPLEEFSCHLGADQGIKIAYKPMFKKKEAGALKVSTFLHKQVIELRNTHRKAVRVLVMDALPLAVEEKIKVTLLEPVIKHPEKYDRQKTIRINKANNIEWDVNLEPGETKSVVLRYSIECPAGECLDFSVSEV